MTPYASLAPACPAREALIPRRGRRGLSAQARVSGTPARTAHARPVDTDGDSLDAPRRPSARGPRTSRPARRTAIPVADAKLF